MHSTGPDHWYELFSRGARDWLRHNDKIREAVQGHLPELIAGPDLITGPEQRLSPIGVPRRNPHGIPGYMQPANDAPAKEPRSTEHSDDAWAHLILRGQYLQQMPIGIFEVEPASSTSVVDRHVVR